MSQNTDTMFAIPVLVTEYNKQHLAPKLKQTKLRFKSSGKMEIDDPSTKKSANEDQNADKYEMQICKFSSRLEVGLYSINIEKR